MSEQERKPGHSRLFAKDRKIVREGAEHSDQHAARRAHQTLAAIVGLLGADRIELHECEPIKGILLAHDAAAITQATQEETDRCIGIGKWWVPENQHGTFADDLRKRRAPHAAEESIG